ncbi:hypothetical protein CIT292_10474 [Citrobacter youngae ATCC 29220]|uniref:Uncharacterized protein n=1 Tax=Citrobacter youngae ATCC 29220 TaxID=500640 RepID=D4BIV7_9ENTR|nr:hypothetical protein CIT292_10474 [Citrobacter youngae ATCC 29220]
MPKALRPDSCRRGKTRRHFNTRKRVKVTPVRNTASAQYLSAKSLQQSY